MCAHVCVCACVCGVILKYAVGPFWGPLPHFDLGLVLLSDLLFQLLKFGAYPAGSPGVLVDSTTPFLSVPYSPTALYTEVSKRTKFLPAVAPLPDWPPELSGECSWLFGNSPVLRFITHPSHHPLFLSPIWRLVCLLLLSVVYEFQVLSSTCSIFIVFKALKSYAAYMYLEFIAPVVF